MIKERKIAIAYSAISDCQMASLTQWYKERQIAIAYLAIKERQIAIAHLAIK